MAVQDIDISTEIAAPVAHVWALLDDSATWPSWTPIERHEPIRPRGPDGLGEERLFCTRRYRIRERIVERRAGQRLSYVLLAGLALRGYRADIDLTPTVRGTAIRWHTTFRAKIPGLGGLYRRALAGRTRLFVEGLAARAEQVQD